MHEAFELEVHGIVSFAAVARTIWRKQIFRAATQPGHMPRHRKLRNYLLHPIRPALGQRNHVVKGFFGENLRQGRPHGCKR